MNIKFSGGANFGSPFRHLTLIITAIVVLSLFSWQAGAGSLVWAKRAGGTSLDRALAVTAFTDGSYVATGQFSDTATFGPDEPTVTLLVSQGSEDIFLAKYNPDGTLAWAKRAGGLGLDSAQGVTAFTDGSFIVTGHFGGDAWFGPGETSVTKLVSAGDLDIFVAKHNSDGTLAWAKRAGGLDLDSAQGVTAFTDGSFIVTGHFGGDAWFGPGETSVTELVSAGDLDIFVAKHNSDGTLAWAKRAGGESDDAGACVTTLGNSSCRVVGWFQSTATFGLGEDNETPLVSAGSSDIFVAMYGPDCESVCEGTSACFHECLFACGWQSFADDCGVVGDGEGGGQRIPMRWSLGMVRAVLCNPGHPHHDAALADYEANLTILEGDGACQEDPATQAMVYPYRHSLAALLLVSDGMQDRVKTCLGLECDYVVYHGNNKATDESFSDDGDLDNDGITNADEYDNIVSLGGTMEDFVEAVMEPVQMSVAATRGLLILTSLLLLVLPVAMWRRSRHAGGQGRNTA